MLLPYISVVLRTSKYSRVQIACGLCQDLGYNTSMTQFPHNNFNRETDDTIYFFTPAFYAFDNFSPYIVEIWGKRFQTSEHAYQWKKFADAYPTIADAIYTAPSPHAVKKIADEHVADIPLAFYAVKIEIMEEILRAKANQHEKVRKSLIESGTKVIVENSPTDSFWGIGPDGVGENHLGKLWMKIRDDYTFLNDKDVR